MIHMEQPVTHYFKVGEGRIAYDDAGAGALVICVPGLGDLRAEYRFLRPYLLDAGYRVVTMDLRGAGQSDTTFTDYTSRAIGSDIVALARKLGAERVTVIGTSMAANSAAWAALEAPDLVQSLVLIGGFVRVHPTNPLLKPAMNLLFGVRPWGPGMWIRYWETLFPSRKPADMRSYAARLKANLGEPGRLEALNAMLNRPDDDAVGDRLSKVNAPALVVMGTRDPDFKDPAAEADWIASQLHGSTLSVEGAGHYPHAEVPEQVGPEIARFLLSSASVNAA